MQFETTLNVVWLSLGLMALASTARIALTARDLTKRRRAWLHIVGVGLIVAALFPYISATDDILRIQNFNAQQEHRHNGKQSRTDDLIRLYETMDTPLVCRISQVAVTFFVIALVVAPVLRAMDRATPFESGRSPPLAA